MEVNRTIGETFLTRLQRENDELFEKVKKLNDFIDTTSYLQLNVEDQRDLKEQFEYMARYSSVLARRLKRHNDKH